MDGIVGMEGHGPSGGEPRKIGVVMASEDCVSLDSVSANIIGYKPYQVDITRIASERGLGKGKLEDIEILGTPLEEVKIEDFELASFAHDILKNVPHFLYRPLKLFTTKLIKIYPALIKEKCVGCGICQKGCPVKAIRMEENYPVIDYDKCIKCYCCHELCPEHAFKIERSWLARKWRIGPQ
jgi:ferredoxin